MTIFSYDDALSNSLKYFNGDELAAKVFIDKYALRNEKNELLEDTPDKMHHRIAKEIARIEKNKFKEPLTEEQIFSYLDRFKKIVLQGSPMFGIGNYFQYSTLSNCYVINPPLDSYGGICQTDEELVQISKRRGGCGTDISHIRPLNLEVKNSSRISTGIIPFMERFSNSIREVGQGGRRGALMLTISVHHPQVLDFASIKKDRNKVTGANISIRLTDEFLNAVKNNEFYEQRWPVDNRKPRISLKVDARKIWKEIIKNAHDMAEPGLLFWDTIIKESPADCYSVSGYATTSCNPCTELPLSIHDSCRLAVINLYNYVENKFTNKARFNYLNFYNDSIILQRLMDNIVDLELEHIDRILVKINQDTEPIEIKQREIKLWDNIRQACYNGRRTGSGITALGDTLAALNIKYGSNESIEESNKIYKTLKLACYRSSINMAKEIGHFPIWDFEKEKNNPFLLRIKDEDKELWEDMKQYGRRNIAILTTAPTGSISLLTQTTSGIEPLFQTKHIRRKKIIIEDENTRIDFIDNVGDKWQEFTVNHYRIKDWSDVSKQEDIKKSPWYNCCAEDLDWLQRVKLQASVQKHIDHAISSTVNLPENVSVNKVAEIYETAWKTGCKGITVYRKNCRSGVLIDEKEKQNKIISSIPYSDAPKRPKELNGRLHFFTVKGDKYYAAVGLFNDCPYEIFTGFNQEKKHDFIPKDAKQGVIIKKQRGDYIFKEQKTEEEYNLSNGHSDSSAEALTRLLSSALRHGSRIDFLVHQLEKTNGDLQSFSKVLARTLKVYIPDGNKITGTNCSNCGSSNIERNLGCYICKDCGNSKCL